MLLHAYDEDETEQLASALACEFSCCLRRWLLREAITVKKMIRNKLTLPDGTKMAIEPLPLEFGVRYGGCGLGGGGGLGPGGGGLGLGGGGYMVVASMDGVSKVAVTPSDAPSELPMMAIETVSCISEASASLVAATTVVTSNELDCNERMRRRRRPPVETVTVTIEISLPKKVATDRAYAAASKLAGSPTMVATKETVGVGGGGEDVTDWLVDVLAAQMVKPALVTEPSVYHRIVLEASRKTPSGPLVPL